MYIPPNGFAGQGQQTQANQLVPAMSGAAPARKRRKTKRAKPKTAPRSSTAIPTGMAVIGSCTTKLASRLPEIRFC